MRLYSKKATMSSTLDVNRRRGQAVADIGSNAVKALKKGQSRWGHHRRRSGPHPDVDSFIRHKELPALVQGAQFGADSQTGAGSVPGLLEVGGLKPACRVAVLSALPHPNADRLVLALAAANLDDIPHLFVLAIAGPCLHELAALIKYARTDQGEARLNLTAQGYYAQLIATFRQNVIDGFSGRSRSGTHR